MNYVECYISYALPDTRAKLTRHRTTTSLHQFSTESVTSWLWNKGTIASKINGTPKGVILSEKLQHSVMKFDRRNKFDFCYYGQVNSLQLKYSVASKWARKHLWGKYNFLLAMVQLLSIKKLLCFSFFQQNNKLLKIKHYMI